MRVISCCHRLAWDVRIQAEGERARAWVARELECDLAEASPGVWREVASAGDMPDWIGGVELRGVIDMRFRAVGERASVSCRLRGRKTVVVNRAPALPRPVVDGLGGLVRTVSVEETFHVARCWFLAWRHLGCVNLEPQVFLGWRTRACAYCVPDAREWIAAGAPLPLDPRVVNAGVYAALEGADMQLGMFHDLEVLLQRPSIVDASYGPCISDEPGVHAWLAVGTIEGRQTGAPAAGAVTRQEESVRSRNKASRRVDRARRVAIAIGESRLRQPIALRDLVDAFRQLRRKATGGAILVDEAYLLLLRRGIECDGTGRPCGRARCRRRTPGQSARRS